jgi:hypothetical protein
VLAPKVIPSFKLEPRAPAANLGFHKIGRLTRYAGEILPLKPDGVLLMKTFFFYVPTVLCGGVCFVYFVDSLQDGLRWPQLAFLAFLPTCFLLMSASMTRMRREISRLRRRVSALEQGHRPTSHAETRPDALARQS